MTEDVLAERAALELEAGGRTLCDLLAAAAERWADLPAYADREVIVRDGKVSTLTGGAP